MGGDGRTTHSLLIEGIRPRLTNKERRRRRRKKKAHSLRDQAIGLTLATM
jgi:hypothetical protein